MRKTFIDEDQRSETEELFHEHWNGGEDNDLPEEELERRRIEKRARRRAEMRREKELQVKRRRIILIAVPVCIAVFVCILGIAGLIFSLGAGAEAKKDHEADQDTAEVSAPAVQKVQMEELVQNDTEDADDGGNDAEITDESEERTADTTEEEEIIPHGGQIKYSAAFSEATDGINEEEVQSKYVVLINLNDSEVLAAKEGKTRINPASMTKILTILTAADYIDDLDDSFKMTIEITDYSYSHDCSAVGFARDEVVTVRDLLYGTILPSGGDAAVGLATYVAGSHEAFVELMNQKLEALGLSGSSHMTNCVGIYDEDHYSTVYDIAMILEAAVNNELCKEVLKAHTYNTSQTPQHPDGITISNWFLRRIEDKDTHGEVVCAKTGFVAQSGSCAASYATDEPGNGFICVTADAHSSWRAIYDHVALYQKYL